jgi:hypothetical protein
MTFREWLSRKIAPSLALDADRAIHLRLQIGESKQWLSAFPDVFQTLQRIERQDSRFVQAWSAARTPGFILAEPIGRFREALERGSNALLKP